MDDGIRPMPPGDVEHLKTAAHELGHGLVRNFHGADVETMRVFKFWGGGECSWKEFEPPSDRHGQEIIMAGCLAGVGAEDRWMKEHGLGPADWGPASLDLEHFRQWQEFFGFTMTEHAALDLALSILDPLWDVLLEHTPELARRGRMSGSKIA